MWHEIRDERDVCSFMDEFYGLHDSCIKEMKYISGAYVDEKLSMYPINDSRILRVLIQRQFADAPVIELEFRGLRFMNLFPTDDKHTCEILDTTLLIADGWIYWCDCGGLSIQDFDAYSGTVICAKALRWRMLKTPLGTKEFYRADDEN